MAFAAPQLGSNMPIPLADPDRDTDMLSDAPEEGHDFDIDVDAMSDGENQDVDFVLDGGNAGAAEPETVDHDMLEATTDHKTLDAPMGEADHVPDEIMEPGPLVQARNGPGGGAFLAPTEAYDANQQSPVARHGPLVNEGVNYPTHSEPDVAPYVPAVTALETSAASDEHHTSLAAAKSSDGQDVPPSHLTSNTSDQQADEQQAETPPALATSDGPEVASHQDQTLETDETVRSNSNQAVEHNWPNRNESREGELIGHVDVNHVEEDEHDEEENHEEDEHADKHPDEEQDALRKPSSSECAAVVSYDGSKLSLFPPVDGLPESYLIDDIGLAERALRELFIACRQALGGDVGEDSQLRMEIPCLKLVVEEDSIECSIITLFQIMDIHHHLNRNDGIENHMPLPLTLKTRPRMGTRLRELTEAISASKGYSSLVLEDDLGEDEAGDETFEEDEDSPDGDALSDDENATGLENEENRGAVANESATERDTNTDDEQEGDPDSTPGDDVTGDLGDDQDDYSEYSDERAGDAGSDDAAQDSIDFKAERREDGGVDEESDAGDESPEEFNTLDPFSGDNENEGQPQLTDDYAGPKFSAGKSTADEAYLGTHEATLNEEEEYAQLDDWLAPEEENFGFADESNPDAVNGSGELGDTESYGNGGVEYGGDWGNEAEAISSPSKLNESPLGKRARDDAEDNAEPESDLDAKRVKA